MKIDERSAHEYRQINDYAVLGDCRTAALVSWTGSIDWLCLPNFTSAACFASLLGGPEHGLWTIRPDDELIGAGRNYQAGSLVLETTLHTRMGSLRICDALVVGTEHPCLVRTVDVLRGSVSFTSTLRVQYEYGSLTPLIHEKEGAYNIIAGPNAILFESSLPIELLEGSLVTKARIQAGDQPTEFVMQWYPSHEDCKSIPDGRRAMRETSAYWEAWSARCQYQGEWPDEVRRSLLTLKALTFESTGAIVAAATTSLPERIGGERNWDYRYVWLRDSAFTLAALIRGGYMQEARGWRDWLARAIAGDPSSMQILYGLYGERQIQESELFWLPGYKDSRPVRIGNAAQTQRQLDVYGEVTAVFGLARRYGLPDWEFNTSEQVCNIMTFLAKAWREPDEGIWEVRGGRRHFTHSKMMTWVAFDWAIQEGHDGKIQGPIDEWIETRQAIHDEICDRGFSKERNSFVQCYENDEVDAALLMIPMLGFLPGTDPRMQGTVARIENDLIDASGLVLRYKTDTKSNLDGLNGSEGAFLPCSFWLVDNYLYQNRYDDARRLFERLLTTMNDVGLFAEEYDGTSGAMLGNLPQAFTHAALVNSAFNLSEYASRLGTQDLSAED